MTDVAGLRVHGDDDHARDNLDGECEVCGTDHRVLESLPNQPIDPEKIQALEEQTGVVLARAIVSVPGSIVGAETEKVCEDIVIGTEQTVRVLTRYSDAGGWVITQELPVPEDRGATPFAVDVYTQLADEFGHVNEDEIERGDLIQ